MNQAERFFQERDRISRLGINLPPVPIATSIGGQQTAPIEILDRWVTHPGTALELTRVYQIFLAAEYGWPQEQCDLFADVVERDGHLRSLLASRTLAVAGKGWQIRAGGDQPIDIRAADELERSLRKTNLRAAIAHQLSAKYYGFAGTEIVWQDEGGFVRPAWFINVPHRRFRFDATDRPLLMTSASQFEGEPLRPGSWIWSIGGEGIAARSGLLRTALWYALFKNWSWRDWVVYADKFGIPIVIGTYKSGPDGAATKEDREQLELAVASAGEDGQVVKSDTTEIEIREAQRTGDSNHLHAQIVEGANKELSKLITGSTLTVESGGPGSFALGKVHESRSFDLVLADAADISDQFAIDVARPFLQRNGLERAALPQLVIHVTRELDPLTRAQVAQILQGMGLDLDQEQLRTEFQFRAPPSPERALGPTPSGDPNASSGTP